MKIKILLYCVLLSVLCGCAGTDITKPDYQFGDTATWQAVRWGGVIRQDLDFSCGLTSVAMILRYHFGDQTATEKKLLEEFIVGLSSEALSEVFTKGASLAQLGDIFTKKDYVIRNWRMDIARLQQVTHVLPAIVYLEQPDFRHFAVVRGVSEYQVLLADPSRGNVRLSIADFMSEWKGRRALLVARDLAELQRALLANPDATESDARTELLRLIVVSPKR